MKKTLVALAVLAASGASFAQVTLSGEFAYGYLSTNDGTGANKSGGGLDTADLVFNAKEDLGGGTSVSVTMKTDGSGGRSGGVTSGDQTIQLKTNSATYTAGSWKPGNWLQGTTGYATWYGLDDRVLSKRGVYDSIGVSVPMGPVTLSVTAYEPDGVIGEGSGNAALTGNAGQQNTTVGLNYTAGALSLSAGYVTFNNQVTSDVSKDNVMRVAGKYDFGVAVVGAGVQVTNLGGDGTNTQTLVSVSAPIGSSMSVNAGWASNQNSVSSTSAIAALDGTRTGYMLGLQYNLSKRTYGILNYGNWLAAKGDAQNANLTALTLVHDF